MDLDNKGVDANKQYEFCDSLIISGAITVCDKIIIAASGLNLQRALKILNGVQDF